MKTFVKQIVDFLGGRCSIRPLRRYCPARRGNTSPRHWLPIGQEVRRTSALQELSSGPTWRSRRTRGGQSRISEPAISFQKTAIPTTRGQKQESPGATCYVQTPRRRRRGCGGRVGGTHLLLALVIRPLTTRPFRGRAPFLLLGG